MGYRLRVDERAAQLFEEAIRLEQDAGDKFALGGAYYRMGRAAWSQGDYEKTTRIFEEVLALAGEVGNQDISASMLHDLGDVALAQGDYEQAARRYEAELAIGREIDSKFAIALALSGLGRAAWARGNYEQAANQLEAALVISREVGHEPVSLALYWLGRVALSRGDHVSARLLLAEVLSIWREAGVRWIIAYNLEAFSALAAAQNQMQRAARLFGAAETLHDLIRFDLSPAEHAEHDRAIATARTALGEEAFTAAWAEGQAMTMEEAIEYALGSEPLKH